MERSRQRFLLTWHVGYQEYTYGLESIEPLTLLEEREWVVWMRRNTMWIPDGAITLEEIG